MGNYNYRKGSEWRKWDLHVHTPFSYLNNQFGDNFDEYFKNLFEKALEKDITDISITDYFIIEGYKKLKNEYLINDQKLRDLNFTNEQIERIKAMIIFPNIEFRIESKNSKNEHIQIHLLFSPEIDLQKVENVLTRLELVSTDDFNLTNKYCTQNDLTDVT